MSLHFAVRSRLKVYIQCQKPSVARRHHDRSGGGQPILGEALHSKFHFNVGRNLPILFECYSFDLPIEYRPTNSALPGWYPTNEATYAAP